MACRKFSSSYNQIHNLKFVFTSSCRSPYYDSWICWKNNIEEFWKDSTITGNEFDYYDVMDEWKKNCNIEKNRNLIVLPKFMGGLALKEDKGKNIKIAFDYKKNDSEGIIMRINNSSEDYWKVEELEDLVNSFKKTTIINNNLEFGIVNGYIEVVETNKFVF